MLKGKLALITFCIALIFCSCVRKAEKLALPLEPEEEKEYRIIEENWISDFNVIDTSKSINKVAFSSRAVVQDLIISQPIHYYSSQGSYPGSGLAATCDFLFEVKGSKTNGYLSYRYEINNEPDGYNEWYFFAFEFITGPIDLHQYGNALIFKARIIPEGGTGIIPLVIYLASSSWWETIDAYYLIKSSELSSTWKEFTFILPWDRGNSIYNIGIVPADVDQYIGRKGNINIDDIRLAFVE